MSGTPVASYEYRDLEGNVVATKHRYVPKTFRWTVTLPDGRDSSKLSDAGLTLNDLPLYRLSDLFRVKGDYVYWVESEKSADRLADIGLTATAAGTGANADVSKWDKRKLLILEGRNVVILPDNDEAGEEHARRVADILSDRIVRARSVRVLRLPGLPEKGDVYDWLENGGTKDELIRLAEQTPPVYEWKPRAPAPPLPTGASLADELKKFIRLFVVVSDEAATALALWVMHTHAFDATEAFTPYLAVTSPTRASGKTTLIDVLAALVAAPTRADSATPAAIYRMVDRGRGKGEPKGRPPTLFLDELDAVFSGGTAKSERSEALRGVLNSGFKRDGTFTVCDGEQNEPRNFVTFCPKVLAGIGKLPDTVTDRSIPIALSRATREELEQIEPARHRSLSKLEPTRDLLSRWATLAIPRLKERGEPVLDGLSARQADIWGPLLNIADDLGGDWPEMARAAALALHTENGDTTDGRDPGTALLADLRGLFETQGASWLSSSWVAESLRSMEDRPWPEYTRGGPISTHAIARLLRAYGISPRLGPEDANGKRIRGYHLEDCQEPFRRYLPPAEGAVQPYPKRISVSGAQPALVQATPVSAPFDSEAVPLAAGGYPADW